MKLRKIISFISLFLILTLVGCSNNIKTDKMGSTNTEIKENDIEIETISVNNTKINLNEYNENIEIDNGGEYTFTGSFNKIISITADKEVTINLENVNNTNEDGPCIYIKNSQNVNFNITGENTLIVKSNTTYSDLDAAIYSKSDIEFSGDGVLNIETLVGNGIKGKDTIIFNSGTYNINSQTDCINANEDIIVYDGIYTLNSNEDECIQSDTNIVIKVIDGVFNTTGDAIKADVLVQVDDGSINIETANEGFESKDKIIINGGDIKIRSNDDCINAANSILINDGNINAISSTNDAIDSNGLLQINDGIIYAIGVTTPEAAFDCDNEKIVINGGTLLGLGTMNSEVSSDSQKSISISLNNEENIETVKVINSNNDIIFECTLDEYTSANPQFANDKKNNKDSSKNMQRPEDNNIEFKKQEDKNMPNTEDILEDKQDNKNIPNQSPNENSTFNDQKRDFKNGLSLFLSNNKFVTNETYQLYINDSLVETFSID